MRTSRTFALNIPLLPDGVREQVGIAYLLFRIADTVEDGTCADRPTKRRLFGSLVAGLESQDATEFCELVRQHPPHDDPDCLELCGELPTLLKALSVDAVVSELVRDYVQRASIGMERFTQAGGGRGNVRLKSRVELHEYCYAVAGLVGEMLTRLFLHHQPSLHAVESELMNLAPLFGEGLQLVNILKDSGDDNNDGRQFVHGCVPRELLFELARMDLDHAQDYTEVLESNGAHPGVVRFTRLPVQLASATLAAVEQHGPGSRVSREEVGSIVADVMSDSDKPEAAIPRAIKVLLAEPRGFCAGVSMAIAALDMAIEKLGTPIYVYHEIVHNRYVVEEFTARGAVFVESVDQVPVGGNLIFSAHGVSPEVRSAARERGLLTIDATCPLVAKVHIEAARFAREGYTILLIGHAGHDEVVGTVGEAPDSIRVIQSAEEIAALDFSPGAKLAWLTQTTLSVSDTARLVTLLEQRFPTIVGPGKDDICYATQNRQAAVQALCDEADAIIVVGSQNSSNSQRLKELALEHNVKSWLVDGADELSIRDFSSCKVVGVTAGASAPQKAVENVLEWLDTNFQTDVEVRTHASEDRVFPLPSELVSTQVGQPGRTVLTGSKPSEQTGTETLPQGEG